MEIKFCAAVLKDCVLQHRKTKFSLGTLLVLNKIHSSEGFLPHKLKTGLTKRDCHSLSYIKGLFCSFLLTAQTVETLIIVNKAAELFHFLV